LAGLSLRRVKSAGTCDEPWNPARFVQMIPFVRTTLLPGMTTNTCTAAPVTVVC
jgi:hypothetical protein